MEQEKIQKVIVPALAIAALVVLVGVLIGMRNEEPGKTGPKADGVGSTTGGGGDASGMSSSLPKTDGPEWKDIGDGLKSWDVVEGTGDAVKPSEKVNVHYTGWTTDGNSFDSSVKRGEPIAFGLNGVIKGWTLGIPGMKPGGIRRLYIPWKLAYGETGSPPKIPARADLVFEVKLLNVEK